mgnify:CR=1 FL=1
MQMLLFELDCEIKNLLIQKKNAIDKVKGSSIIIKKTTPITTSISVINVKKDLKIIIICLESFKFLIKKAELLFK